MSAAAAPSYLELLEEGALVGIETILGDNSFATTVPSKIRSIQNLLANLEGVRAAQRRTDAVAVKPAPAQASLSEQIDAEKAHREQGPWYPACGGREKPFKSRGGHRMQYMWQPSTGRHAYLNLDSDMIMTDEEARLSLGTF